MKQEKFKFTIPTNTLRSVSYGIPGEWVLFMYTQGWLEWFNQVALPNTPLLHVSPWSLKQQGFIWQWLLKYGKSVPIVGLFKESLFRNNIQIFAVTRTYQGKIREMLVFFTLTKQPILIMGIEVSQKWYLCWRKTAKRQISSLTETNLLVTTVWWV